MAWFDKISETFASTGKEVVDAAKTTADIAGLRGRIKTQEDLISKYYKEIGRYVYENRGDLSSVNLEERFHLVDTAYEELSSLKNQLDDLKGIDRCENCGTPLPEGAVFCPGCGRPVKKNASCENDTYEQSDAEESGNGEAESASEEEEQ